MTEPMRKTILESVHKINNQISFYIIENTAVEEGLISYEEMVPIIDVENNSH